MHISINSLNSNSFSLEQLYYMPHNLTFNQNDSIKR